MPTCPNGHQSGSDDWCEVCGHRMAGAGAVPPPPPPPPAAPGYAQQGPGGPGGPGGQAELCPQCRTPREANAPFCEECRWNFLTNTATSYTPVAPQQPLPGRDGPAGFPSRPQRPDAGEYTDSGLSQMNRPAEPLSGGLQEPGHRQGPPPPAFQQGAPPPGFAQGPPPPAPLREERPPAPPRPGAPSPGFDDDWVLPPPSGQAVQAPPPGPQGPGDPGYPGGYGYPQRTQTPQAPQTPQGPQAPMGWSATIGPDREYFMAMMQRSGPEASGLNLPAYSPEQQRPLVGNQLTIGRRRHSTGDTPDIDLSVPPEDPGVSHQHAILVQQPDGSWAVVDQNSTNGTTVNGGEDPIQPFVPVPLQDGDRVHVGAWTTITIRRV
ncbi:FHA domain-containing protein [Streptomyces sp. O3]